MLIGVLILVVFMMLAIIGNIVERKLWNKGRCRCGERWVKFDTDSQGGRGYVCRKCEKYIWISWFFID